MSFKLPWMMGLNLSPSRLYDKDDIYVIFDVKS